MKILFTGASSFTGYWIVQELAAHGHSVYATLQKSQSSYDGLKKIRLEKLRPLCRLIDDCPFGSQRFLDLIQEEAGWDLFCHHAAQTSGYKSRAFDFAKALEKNTYRLPAVLNHLQAKDCHRILWTGTVFEPGEGGSPDNQAVSPYGLSKGLTWQAFRYFAESTGMRLGKFVISNPFGPYEEHRFTSYFIRSWVDGTIPTVNTPSYIRDNIHVRLLAQNYRFFAESLPSHPGIEFCRPCGYIETQAEFTRRLSHEMSRRLSIDCPFQLKEETDFSEPLVRFNAGPSKTADWNEARAWDALADFYRREP